MPDYFVTSPGNVQGGEAEIPGTELWENALVGLQTSQSFTVVVAFTVNDDEAGYGEIQMGDPSGASTIYIGWDNTGSVLSGDNLGHSMMAVAAVDGGPHEVRVEFTPLGATMFFDDVEVATVATIDLSLIVLRHLSILIDRDTCDMHSIRIEQ